MSAICDDLRVAIIQAALQGELTKQLPEDEDAIDLLERIKAEKGRLLPIKQELPFDIPENWQVVALKDIAEVLYGFPFNSQLFNKDGNGFPLIRIRDILPSKTMTFTTERTQNSYVVRRGDMLVGMDGNFNVNFWDSNDAYLNQRCCKITTNAYYEQRLLYWFLPYFLNEIFENVSYVTVKHLSDKHLTKMTVPLPPLAEQKRIVEKIDELMTRVDDLEKSADALASLKKAFPSDIKSALLQSAMQGKLTKQLPEDGDASELLKEAAKARGISVKKNKESRTITDEEKPFAIPDSWSWARVGDVFSHNTGKTKNAAQNTSGESRKYITTSNLYWNYFDFGKVGKMNFKKEELERYTAKKGDLLVCEGGDFGRTAIWNYDEEVCFQNHVHRLRFFYQMNAKFFYWLFYFYKHSGLIKGKGIGIQGLSSGALHNIVFPIPPLAEQERIVERLDALMQNIEVVSDLIAAGE